MRMSRGAAALSLACLAALAPAAGADPVAEEPLPFRLPPGYRVTERARLADGVEHVRLESRSPLHVVDLGFTRPESGHRVDVRHAGPRSSGPDRRLQGTSQMCGDDCAYATNGDYAKRQPSRVVGHPFGGIVSRGTVLVSPDDRHQQASFTYDGGFTTKRLKWTATAARVAITGKNVVREPGALVLYTPDYVRSTGTGRDGVELTLRLPEGDNLVPNADPVVATLVSIRPGRGDAPVRPGTVVLSGSGHNATRLRMLWRRGADLSLAETLSPDVWASVGGGHVLIRDRKRYLRPENAPHLTTTHPRTFAGAMPDGTLFSATVDGRERNAGRSVGMPLEEAVRFFRAMGVREVINLDGGGSTTFVRRGRILNVPSDGGERVVTTAVVVVRGRIRQRPVAPPPLAKPVRERPELPAYGRVTAWDPPVEPIPPIPWPVWVAVGNLGALVAAFTSLWVRRGVPTA